RIQQWNDSEATATIVAEEAVDGKPCYVVELKPKNDEFPYERYRLWFGKDDLFLWRLDMYEEGDTEQKRVTPKKYQRFDKYETPIEADGENVPAGTRTFFEVRDVRYDKGVPEQMFSITNLDRG